jgi:hypothetical protein
VTRPLFDLLLITLTGVQALGLTFGLAALCAVGGSALLKPHTEALYVLMFADPIVRRPLLRAGIVLTIAGLTAYLALAVMVRWWPY